MVTNIEKEDLSISFTIPTIGTVKRHNNYNYISLYQYNLSFCEIFDYNIEIICHLHTRNFSMDACLFIVDLINEDIFKEWHDCQITESTPWYTDYIYEHLECLQQILTSALQTKEELFDFYEDEFEEDTEEFN